jgi:hypothetical protein
MTMAKFASGVTLSEDQSIRYRRLSGHVMLKRRETGKAIAKISCRHEQRKHGSERQ